ncbi:hypothetical protein [Devosia riboflavina]|uniref:hypothetical protein n=1 Tax=Devosia riboflavina TaxID=46914 RepID=UPI00069094F8|nr:hypothetical protein [Devosia riboflavina]
MTKLTILKPRQSKWDARSPEAEQYRKLYKTARWRRVRALQLSEQPLCENCQRHGRVTAATVCDHVDPKTKLNPATFFTGPFQSLCDDPRWRCHSSVKQSIEKSGFVKGVAADGRPLDASHPWNRA